MIISHEEFLKRQLESDRLELRELEVQNRIRISEFEAKRNILWKRLDSIESQLRDHKDKKNEVSKDT